MPLGNGEAAALTEDATMPKEPVPANWNDMPPGDKQAWLLDLALDRKREILAIPLPDDGDDSSEATRLRALILSAADSAINQTIALRSSALSAAQDARDNELLQLIEGRRQKAPCRLRRCGKSRAHRTPLGGRG
jgi:hypothetical protein